MFLRLFGGAISTCIGVLCPVCRTGNRIETRSTAPHKQVHIHIYRTYYICLLRQQVVVSAARAEPNKPSCPLMPSIPAGLGRVCMMC